MRNKTITLVILLILLVPSSNAFAAQGLSSSVQFNQTVHLALYGGFGKISNKANTSGYPGVNSKWNQPRKVNGTNPHEGVDFNLVQYDKFILPYAGFILNLPSNSTSGKNATFVVMLDVNGNKIMDDNVWLRVRHTKTLSTITTNTWYGKGTAVGEIQDYYGDGNTTTKQDHLHFGVVYDSGTYEEYGPMQPYYNGTVEYNNGKHLDLISQVTPTNSGLSFTTYIKDETSSSPQLPNNIVIFHKKSTESNWKRYNVTTNTTNNYFVSWSTLGYSTGQFTNIQFIIRVGRFSGYNDLLTQWDYYNWGYYPAKFQRPDPDPDNSNSSPQPHYSTYVLQ